jgi:hypothetical protein
VVVNGKEETFSLEQGFLVLDREWHDACVELQLPMQVRFITRANGAIGVRLGPLVLTYCPGEVWSRLPGSPGFGDYEVRPRRSWNIALLADEAAITHTEVERHGPQSPPFGLRTGPPPFGIEDVPVKVWVPGFPGGTNWPLERNSAALPPSPSEMRAEAPILTMLDTLSLAQVPRAPLVPYGCARLRVAEFPTFSLSSGTLAASSEHGRLDMQSDA